MFPWESGEIPYYEDPSGTKWWLDKDMTQHARRDIPMAKGLVNVAVFFVKVGDYATRIAIDDKRSVLAEDQTLEGMGCKLDILKIARNQ